MKIRENYDKLRGGYYTPEILTEFICKWAVRQVNDNILEPSCGDGNFIKSAADILRKKNVSEINIKKQVLGIELDGKEVDKARLFGGDIVESDFFTYYLEKIYNQRKFDVVIGNPPFIRYQNFVEEYRKTAFELMKRAGMSPNRLTNIWVPFLILSCECLTDRGRLGMVIPAELFQVDYAAETRLYLSQKFERLIIVTFNKLLFDGAQQEVVLLLGEKYSNRKGIEVIELNTAQDLEDININEPITEVKQLDHTSEKWVKYYLTNKELSVIKKMQDDNRLTKTTDLFEVNVGVVSGQNDFFILNRETIKEYSIEHAVQPIIGRAEQLKGILLNMDDLEDLENAGKKVFLFAPQDVQFDNLSKYEQQYIIYGQNKHYDRGYKCRIRKRWYIVPKSWQPEAFMLRQINKYPKIVLNESTATNTDTLHKIRFLNGVKPEQVATAFLNSFTLAQCELTGRSYGGGVMTFEPGEVRKLQIPMIGAEELDLNYIDSLMRQGKIIEILDYTDNILLKKYLNLSDEEISLLRNVWEKMSNRRIDRKKKQNTNR